MIKKYKDLVILNNFDAISSMDQSFSLVLIFFYLESNFLELIFFINKIIF